MTRFPYRKIIILLSMVILLQVTGTIVYAQIPRDEYLASRQVAIDLSDPHEGSKYSGNSPIITVGDGAGVMIKAPPNVQSIDLTVIIKSKLSRRLELLQSCDSEEFYGSGSRRDYCKNFMHDRIDYSLSMPIVSDLSYATRVIGKPPFYFIMNNIRYGEPDKANFEVEVRINGVESTGTEPCGGSSFSDATPLPNRYCGTSKYASDQERYFKFDIKGETKYVKIKISKANFPRFFKLTKISEGDTNAIYLLENKGRGDTVEISGFYRQDRNPVNDLGATEGLASIEQAIMNEINEYYWGKTQEIKGTIYYILPYNAGVQIPPELIAGGAVSALAIAGGYYLWRHQRPPTSRPTPPQPPRPPRIIDDQALRQHRKPRIIEHEEQSEQEDRREEDNRGVIINSLSPADKFADYYDPCERLEISVNASNNNEQQTIIATMSLKIDERTLDMQYITFAQGETRTIPMQITLPNKKGTYRITAHAEGLHTNSISDGFQIKVGSPLAINEIGFKNESEDKTYEPGSSQDIKVVANNKCMNTINATLKVAVKEIYSGAESGLQEIGPDPFQPGSSEHSIWIEMPKEEGEYQIKATLVSEEGEILYEHTSSKFNVVQSKGHIIDIHPLSIPACGSSELEIRVQNDREWRTTFKLKLVSNRLNIERKEDVFDVGSSSNYPSKFEISPKVVEPGTESVIKAEATLFSKSGNELHKRIFDLTVEPPEVYAEIKVNPSGNFLGIVLGPRENKTVSRGDTFNIEVFVENRSGNVIGLCSNFKLVLPKGMRATLDYDGAISAAKDSLHQKFGNKIKESYLSADSLLEYNSALDSWARNGSTIVDDILPKFIENFDKPKFDFISSLTQLPQRIAEEMYESTFNRMTSMVQSSIQGLSLGDYSFFDVLKPGGNAKFVFTVDVSTINIKPEIKVSPVIFHLPYVVLSKEDDVTAAIGSAGIFNGNMGNALQIYADVGKILEKPKELAFSGLMEALQAGKDGIMDTSYIDSWLKRYGGNEREFFQKSYGKPCVVTAQDIVLIK